MVTQYGMDEEVGPATYESDSSPFLGPGATGMRRRTYSEETAREIDSAVRELLQAAFEQARAILSANREALETGAKELLANEKLDEAELAAIFSQMQATSLEPAAASAARD